MKKILILSLSLIFMIGITACDLIGNGTKTQRTPGIQGAVDTTLAYGQFFDPLHGVWAMDESREVIEAPIRVQGIEQMNLEQSRVVNPGEFVLVYEVEDNDNNAYVKTRLITVLEEGQSLEDSSPSVEECGNPVVGDYVIVWCDEFTGEGENVNAYGVDLDKWGFQVGTGSEYGLTGWGNDEAQYYREHNARVEDGRLIIEARHEAFETSAYTSARLWTKPTFYQQYGRFEARIKLPVGDGLWPAFWMMPQYDVYGGWAASGEIDIMEARGRFPDRSIGALHFGDAWPNNTHTHRVYHFPAGQTIADFNVYAIEWEEGEIRWYVNDTLIKRSTQWHTEGHDFPAPFDQDFYLLLNLAVGGSFDGGVLPPADLFNDPVMMEVEYVRVYQKNSD